MPFSDVRGGVYIKGGKELMMTAFVGFFLTFRENYNKNSFM